jgi:hypothetical protein
VGNKNSSEASLPSPRKHDRESLAGGKKYVGALGVGPVERAFYVIGSPEVDEVNTPVL